MRKLSVCLFVCLAALLTVNVASADIIGWNTDEPTFFGLDTYDSVLRPATLVQSGENTDWSPSSAFKSIGTAGYNRYTVTVDVKEISDGSPNYIVFSFDDDADVYISSVTNIRLFGKTAQDIVNIGEEGGSYLLSNSFYFYTGNSYESALIASSDTSISLVINGKGGNQLSNALGQSWTVSVKAGSGTAPTPSPTPEPATMLIFGVGMVGAGLVARRRMTK
ncbi:MAG: PEP-CTERM sorting domain-containing protein [Planctomycetaceae bacterium]|jgi:hypothetical protein|nr:PEP-CTERM sorting domain-containing protein [Planctomycetaceae bacterium]